MENTTSKKRKDIQSASVTKKTIQTPIPRTPAPVVSTSRKTKKSCIEIPKLIKYFTLFKKEAEGVELITVQNFQKDNLKNDSIGVNLPPIFSEKSLLLDSKFDNQWSFLYEEKQIGFIPFNIYLEKLKSLDLSCKRNNSLQQTMFDFVNGRYELQVHKFFDRMRLFYSFISFAKQLEKYRSYIPWLDIDVPFESYLKCFIENQLVLEFINPDIATTDDKSTKFTFDDNFPSLVISNTNPLLYDEFNNENNYNLHKINIETFSHFSFWEDVTVTDLETFANVYTTIGNLPFLYFPFRWSIQPFLYTSDASLFQNGKKRPDKEVSYIINDLIKTLGKTLFGISPTSPFTHPKNTNAQKEDNLFGWVDQVFRYLVEPSGLFKSAEEQHDNCVNSCKNIITYIIDNPWLPEINWIPNIKNLALFSQHDQTNIMLLQLYNSGTSTSEFLEHLSVFRSKNADKLVWNNVHKLYLNYQAPFPVQMLVQTTKPIYSHKFLLPFRDVNSSLIGHLFSTQGPKSKYQFFSEVTDLELSLKSYFNRLNEYLVTQRQKIIPIFRKFALNYPKTNYLKPIEIITWINDTIILQNPDENKLIEPEIHSKILHEKFQFFLNLPLKNSTILNSTFYSRPSSNRNTIEFWLAPFEPGQKDQLTISIGEFPNYVRTQKLNRGYPDIWEMHKTFEYIHNNDDFWKTYNCFSHQTQPLKIASIQQNAIFYKIEYCFLMMFMYLNYVWIPPDWEKYHLKRFLQNCSSRVTLEGKSILPVGLNGGDSLIMLVCWATQKASLKKDSIQFVNNNWFFDNWLAQKDLSSHIREGYRDFLFYSQFEKMKNDIENDTDHDGDSFLPQNKISIFMDWTVEDQKDKFKNLDKIKNILNRFHVAFGDGEQKRGYLRNMFKYSISFIDPEEKKPIGQGRGVEQTAMTLVVDIFNDKLDSKFFLAASESLEKQHHNKDSFPIHSLESCHISAIGRAFNYMFLQNIEAHVDQPPLFWKLIGFNNEAPELQDLVFIDPFLTVQYFDYICDETMDLEVILSEEDGFNQKSTGLNIPRIQTFAQKYNFYKEQKVMDPFVHGLHDLVRYFMKDGFNMTKLDFSPSYRFLYSNFYSFSAKDITPERVLSILRVEKLESGSMDRFHSRSECIENGHIDLTTNHVCPITNLVKWIGSATNQQLLDLIHFCTAKNSICKNSLINVCVQLSKNEKLPETHTCAQSLEFWWNDSAMFESPEQSYILFAKNLERALLENKTFGQQ